MDLLKTHRSLQRYFIPDLADEIITYIYGNSIQNLEKDFELADHFFKNAINFPFIRDNLPFLVNNIITWLGYKNDPSNFEYIINSLIDFGQGSIVLGLRPDLKDYVFNRIVNYSLTLKNRFDGVIDSFVGSWEPFHSIWNETIKKHITDPDINLVMEHLSKDRLIRALQDLSIEPRYKPVADLLLERIDDYYPYVLQYHLDLIKLTLYNALNY